MKKRTVAVLCAVAIVIGVAIGGTMALLQHSAAVVNTFTAGTIAISLSETKDGEPVPANDYVMVPGETLTKDPKVTVAKDSESCYLFVKVKEINFNGLRNPINWEEIKSPTNNGVGGWTAISVDGDGNPKKGAGDDGYVFYRIFDSKDPDGTHEEIMTLVDGKQTKVDGYTYNFLKDNQVTVSAELTKADMTDYGKNEKDFPKLEFTAYAIQRDWLKDQGGNEITQPAQIWNIVQKATAENGQKA